MVLFYLQLRTLKSYMTNHTTMVASWNKFRSIQNLMLRPKWRLWLKILSLHLLISFVWRNVHQFFLWGRTHNRHKIGYRFQTTWLQQIFSSFLVIGSAIKHLVCILRNSFSHFSLLTSLLDKTSLASKSTFKHSNSLSFSREFLANFLYFSTNLLDSLSLAIKSSFSQINLLKFLRNFFCSFFKSF